VNSGEISTLYARSRTRATTTAGRPSFTSRTWPIPPVEEIAVVGFKAEERSIEHFPPRHDDDIESRCDPIPPEDLTRQPLCAVALDRLAQLARRRNTESTSGATVRHDEERHQPTLDPHSCIVGAFELRSVPDTGRSWQPLVGTTTGRRHSDPLRSAFVGDRQTLAPLGAPAREHDSAVLGRHANPEAVSLRAAAGIRLIRTLALHVVSRGRGYAPRKFALSEPD